MTFFRKILTDKVPYVLYLGHALVPSLDHLAFADLELEWLAAIARAVHLQIPTHILTKTKHKTFTENKTPTVKCGPENTL